MRQRQNDLLSMENMHFRHHSAVIHPLRPAAEVYGAEAWVSLQPRSR